MTIQQYPKLQELVTKLREIFQIDRPELDFGIYRILNARAGEINDCLQNRLAEKVQAALSSGNQAPHGQAVRAMQENETRYQVTWWNLVGLRVKHINAQPQRGFVTVTGTLPSGETCLVLWRDCDVLDYEGISQLCNKLAINPADNKFDVVYINGDHNIPTILTQTAAQGGATRVFKLRQIEPEFLERMFSVEDI